MLDEKEVDALVDCAKSAGLSPRIVVIDTLARCFIGGDENSTRDMGLFVHGCDRLREAFPGATVLVVHHTGKDAKRGDRGSTALRAAADTRIQIWEAKDGTRIVQCEKQKDAERFKTMAFTYRKVRHSIVLEPAKVTQSTDNTVKLIATLSPQGMTHTAWFKASGLKVEGQLSAGS
jgi:hypothetical protein